MLMENRKFLIITGILAIIIPILFFAIPFGTDPLQIINLAIFIFGLIAVPTVTFIKKSDKLFMISALIYIAILVAFTTIVEHKISDNTFVAIGFLPGLIISLTGLIRTRQTCKSKACYIINGIALLIAIAGIVLPFFAGWTVR